MKPSLGIPQPQEFLAQPGDAPATKPSSFRLTKLIFDDILDPPKNCGNFRNLLHFWGLSMRVLRARSTCGSKLKWSCVISVFAENLSAVASGVPVILTLSLLTFFFSVTLAVLAFFVVFYAISQQL